MQGLKNFWIGIIDFSRMESRKDYWTGILLNGLIALMLIILGLFIRIIVPYIAIIFAVVSILPTISMTVRRLHDVDESGFYMFYIFIPIAGAVVIFLKTIKPTLYNPNEVEQIQETSESSTTIENN